LFRIFGTVSLQCSEQTHCAYTERMRSKDMLTFFKKGMHAMIISLFPSTCIYKLIVVVHYIVRTCILIARVKWTKRMYTLGKEYL
jgi:hypothetical protein